MDWLKKAKKEKEKRLQKEEMRRSWVEYIRRSGIHLLIEEVNVEIERRSEITH